MDEYAAPPAVVALFGELMPITLQELPLGVVTPTVLGEPPTALWEAKNAEEVDTPAP